MQFSCESCKAQLQIADEKVKGKRLIVRCRRCGAKIAIADPGLSKAPPRLVGDAATPSPSRPPPSRPPPSRPPPSPQPAAPGERPATDLEDTRSMESDVLEKAIQASKAEEPRQNGVPSRPPPPPVATPTDAPTWFAMLQGKQTGPLTRKEVEARTNGAEIGPRTYLWREGMSAWQRAKDVPELTGLFPQPPGPSLPPPLPAAPRTQPEPRKTPPGLERDARKPASPLPEGRNPAAPAVAPVAEVPAGKPLPDPAPSPLDPLLAHPPVPVVDDARATTAIEKKAAELAQWATEELARRSLPVGAQDPAERATMFESAAPERRSATFLVAVVLAILAAAALVLWVGLSERDRKENAPAEKSGLLRPEKRGRRA